MSSNIIDTLSIEIESNIGQSNIGIDKLSDSLYKLQQRLGGLQTGKIGKMAGELKKLSEATNKMEFGKLSDFSTSLKNLSDTLIAFSSIGNQLNSVTKNLKKILNLDFSKLNVNGDFSGLAGLATGIDSITTSAQNLSMISPRDINRAVAAFDRLKALNLNDVANSLRSLNGIDASVLGNLGASFQGFISSLAGSEKVPSAIANMFGSLSQLAASAGSMPIVTSILPRLSSAVTDFVTAISSAPIVQQGTADIITALSGIANAGAKAEKVSAALPRITEGVHGFVTALSSVPALDEGIIRTVESLARLAEAGDRTGSTAIRLEGQITRLSTSMVGLSGESGKAVNGLRNFAKQMLSMLGIAGGIYGIVKAVKASITAASDLSEAQNVIQQGFGPLIGKIEEFSKTSIQSFGMSELAAKNTAGIYAVMGKSLGVLPDKATDMAVALTGLTGDLASFYNVSQDVANTALKSVFTGETESLKKFGVVMTEANLKAFALSQGITKSYSAMSQAEKVQLRYAFVMDATSDAIGDFSRTAGGSWANQVRILSQQFQQLAGIVGGVLMSAFLPVIKIINTVMSKIIQLANILSSFANKLFGVQGTVANSGAGLSQIADSTESIAGGAEEAADGISDVGGAAGKSEKQLNSFSASWNEVNSMSSNEGGNGGGGGGDLSSGVELPDMPDMSNYEMGITAVDEASPVIDRIKERLIGLKDLFMEGFKLGVGDTSSFDSIKENIQNIGTTLKNVFSDTDVVTNFNILMDTLSVNAGIKVGSFVSIGFSIMDNIVGGVSKYLEESEDKIKDWLIEMFDITGEMDTIVTEFINSVSDIFTVFQSDDAKSITRDVVKIFGDGFMESSKLAAKFGRDVSGLVLDPITENSDGIKEAISNTLSPLKEVLDTLSKSFTHLWETVNETYDKHVKPTIDSFKEGITEIVESLLKGYNEHIAPVLDKLSKRFTEVWEGTIEPLLDNFIGLFGDVADLIRTVWENVLQPVINWIAQRIFPLVAPVLEKLGMGFLNTFEKIGQILDDFITNTRKVITFLTDLFSGDWEKVWENISDMFKKIWDNMPGFIKTPIQSIIGFVNKMIEGIEKGINYVVRAINGLSFDVPDWVPGIGGETFGFDLNEISLGRIPQLAQGGIVEKTTLALIGESGKEAVVPLERNTEWINTLSERLAKNFSQYKNVRMVGTSDIIASDKYTTKEYDARMEGLRSSAQMEMDAHMAEQEFENRQLREAVERNGKILEEILDKGIILDNNEFTKRFKVSATDYRRRTGNQLGVSY